MALTGHIDPGLGEWEAELPAPEELIPLTQTLIPPDLASAFKIVIEPPSHLSGLDPSFETMITTQCIQPPKPSPSLDPAGAQLVCPLQQNLASSLAPLDTAGLRPINFLDHGLSPKELKLEANLWTPGAADQQERRATWMGYDDARDAGFVGMDAKVENGVSFGADSCEGGSSKKLRKRLDTDFEDANSSVGLENSNEESTPRTLKRPRLVWTPQLHKRFVEAVAQLGIKNAVPKTIMQLMNVDGLTRENVASHLQKYRLYLKRMQGLSPESPTTSDHLFTSNPFPPSLSGSPHFLPNHGGDDLAPFLMPLPMSTLAPAHLAEKLHLPLSNADGILYNGLIQPFPCQRTGQDYVFDGRTQAGSSQRRALTLFPQHGI